MYTTEIIDPTTNTVLLTLETNNRNYARILEIICVENTYNSKTTMEVAPKVIKFRNLEPTPVVQAKVDAVADMKEAAKGK